MNITGVEVKVITDVVLVKKGMLRYVKGEKSERGLSGRHVVLCKVRLVGAWIKRREVVNGARRIRSEKTREHQYKEAYVRCLEIKRVEWDEESNVENILYGSS